MESAKKPNTKELIPFQLSELTKLNPKILNYKMSALKLTDEQKLAVRRARRLERARLYEQKKRSNLDFKINMLEAERNALLAVLDDLHEDVAQLRKSYAANKSSVSNREPQVHFEDIVYRQQQPALTAQEYLSEQHGEYYPPTYPYPYYN